MIERSIHTHKHYKKKKTNKKKHFECRYNQKSESFQSIHLLPGLLPWAVCVTAASNLSDMWSDMYLMCVFSSPGTPDILKQTKDMLFTEKGTDSKQVRLLLLW